MVSAATPRACSTDPKQDTARLTCIGRSANGVSSRYATSAVPASASSAAASPAPYIVTSQLLEDGTRLKSPPPSRASAPAAALWSPVLAAATASAATWD